MNSKKVSIKILTLLFLVLFTSACNNEPIVENNEQTTTEYTTTQTIIVGAGSIVSKNLNLGVFSEIEVANGCNLEVVTGATNNVEYSEYENIIDYLKFEITGNKLIIKTMVDNAVIQNSKAKAKLTVAGSLKGLLITGSGAINLVNTFNELEKCSVTGSGTLKTEANATAVNLNCFVSGSGSILFSKMKSENADCTVTGSGSIAIEVSKTLTATIRGSGNISYAGTPTLSSTITGSGKLIKL